MPILCPFENAYFSLNPIDSVLTKKGTNTCRVYGIVALCIPIAKKSAVAHHGRTLHYSRGNSTSGNRRAYILNFRPQAMIDLERSLGFDHTGKRSVQS